MQILKYIRKYRNIITVFLIVLLITGSLIIKNNLDKQKFASVESDLTFMSYAEDDADDKINNIETGLKVDIKGAIEYPGVYEGDSNTRIIDIINMAGGLKDNANTNVINLAKKISDEMVIIIYTDEQVDKILNDEVVEDYEIIETEEEKVFPEIKNDALIEKENTNTSSNNNSNSNNNNSCNPSTNDSITSTSNDIIDINTASISDFDSLPGIGESKAKLIVEYRDNNGPFQTIDEIKNVSGIGEALFEKIKAYIKV